MHQAYNAHCILKQGVHIEAIAAYDNNVILGTRSGQLIMYSVDENVKVTMPMFNKSFSKKAITQMEVIAAERLLFVLTDGMIHVCDISRIENNFALINISADTKGCSLFTLDVKPTKSTTGETATVIRVCCAIKRRLQFFYWKFDSLKAPEFSIELKDVPKVLCWVDDVICVGFKDEYVIYNIKSNTPEKHDLIVTSSSQNIDPCICRIKNNILGVSKDKYLVAIDPTEYCKNKNDKALTQGSLDSATAKTSTRSMFKPMLWSSPLLDLVWDEPYAIGRVSNAIEVRCLEANGITKDTLVQTIPELGKTILIVRSGKGTIFAAAISELWYINMVDIPTQRQQLLQQRKFKLAIELTNISEEPEEVRAETIRQIHMRYASELFASKQFAEAMKEFEEAAADPYDVIRLFPNLLQDQSGKAPAATEGREVTAVPLAPLEDKDLENAIMALIKFLTSVRKKSMAKTLLSIIDTTLLKCYLQTNDSLVPPLLRLKQCHLEESERALKKYNKISELIILYQVNDRHKKALELLQAQAAIEGSSLYGHNRTIRYLQQLGSTHLHLIFEFADWVLQKYPEDGLRVFTEDFIEVENLPRANVLDFLLSKHKALVTPYLEHVINVWHDPNTLLHNLLVKKYREKVQQLLQQLQQKDTAVADEQTKSDEEQLKFYRSKLHDLLKNSDKYSPDVVLQEFPRNMMLEERALILGRLKKHDKVLVIYIQILGDVSQAALYCEQNYPDDQDIFLTLLKTILNPLKQSPYEDIKLHPDFITPNQEVVLELLNKYTTKIDLEKLWPYLPDDMYVHRLSNYLDTVLRTQMAESHELEIKKGLLSAEIRRVSELIQQHESKFVEITELTVCPECGKRFTNLSAFVRYPNGEVMHLSCHDKKEQHLT